LDQLEKEWNQLVAHVKMHGSELVLLPEMPFYPWIAATDTVDALVWQDAVDAHEQQMGRFPELAPAFVLGSRPVIQEGERLNEAFVWSSSSGYASAHHKYYLPDEDGFWEASWYARGSGEFKPEHAGEAMTGFAICTELWFTEHARKYAKRGIQLLACPRATERSTVDKWMAGGRAAAVMAGAFCISSNRAGTGSGIDWGGSGWVIDPDGTVLEVTSEQQPFITLELDLSAADQAKASYPRYVIE
jgi:N-carbamoylputrescine amidase